MYYFLELRDLRPNIHIHVSVSDLNIPRIGLRIFLQQNRQIDCGNIEIAQWHMNVEIEIVGAQFLFWEYVFWIFGIGSLQCRPEAKDERGEAQGTGHSGCNQ